MLERTIAVDSVCVCPVIFKPRICGVRVGVEVKAGSRVTDAILSGLRTLKN